MTANIRNPTPRRPISRFLILCVAGFSVYQLVSPNLFSQKRKQQAYEYLQLREGTKEIRLLTLHPGSSWVKIRCDLAVASLEPLHAPKYHALSYTWNEPIQPSAPVTTFRGFYQHSRALYWHYCRRSQETIIMNGLPFPVTRNLATALRHIRHREKSVDLWIDAICINQNDDTEKSQQVRMMPDIYSKAHRTLIWLGPRADQSDEAMEFIRSAPSIRTDDANLDIDNLVSTRALTALFNRTWWQRVWVIQELVLSQQAVVMCGRKAVPMANFQTLVQKESGLRRSARLAARSGCLKSPNQRAWNFIPPILPFYEILGTLSVLRRKASEKMSTKEAADHLAELVQQTSRFRSTLPRDKVYGLLGIVPDVQRSIEPSYGPGKTDGDVFKELTVLLMRWTNSIDHIFSWRKPEVDRVRGAPSWAISTVSTAVESGKPEALPFDRRRYSADGGFWTWLRLMPVDVIKGFVPEPPALSAATTDSANSFWEPSLRFIRERVTALRSGEYGANPEFSADSNILRLHGLIFDTVVAASPSPKKTYPLDIFRVSEPTTNSTWATLWAATVQYHRAKQMIFQWEAFLKANTAADSKMVTTQTADPYLGTDGGGGRREAFWRAIMANQIREPDGSFGTPDDKFMKEVPGMFCGEESPMSWGYWKLFWSPKSNDQTMAYRRFVAECFRVVTGRSFILTEKGFMGLGPVDVKMGDVVCVVRGCKMPVILRPVAEKENVYRLVGDCYVHGIMDGGFAQGAHCQDVKRLDIE
ncbi:uncharacterized protein FRV6_16570 [Fusarium oxysporum]|uniref:Heterokaryon incompatibility domain-containing protein n=1 Tax=Fusarium oxysporum TaxID=5507 RepID=A0A2H3TV06_FUSOX|nr:uncharacterized protein FRV6_16570 [Fusarium oxysporum]